MLHDCKQEKITVVKLGRLDSSEVCQVLFRANQEQHAFRFEFDYDTELPLSDSYRLPNNGYDLCTATKTLLSDKRFRKLPRPLIVISAEPLGEREHPNEPGWFYFSSQECDYDPKVTIMSTQPLDALPGTRTLEDYLLMMLTIYILTTYADMSFHSESRGCFLDYCDELKEAEHCLRIGRLCDQCEQTLQKKVLQNQISIDKVAAAMKLLNKSVRRKYCFVAMPFDTGLEPVYEIIRQALVELGWNVKRADEVSYPRLITSRIFKEILISDLVLADLTGLNPNVAYEVGMAHVIGHDILLLTQEEKLPFDLANEQAVFYSIKEPDKLKKSLKAKIGSSVR